MNGGDAVRRYKELADLNTDAVLRMREHDRTVADELRARLAEVDRLLAEATARERVARMAVRLHWESAVEALWNEKWLRVGPQPGPTTPPPPGLSASMADAEVGRTYEALKEALRKPALLPRRQQHDD
ncbi:MAG TPA: hypothetical protein VH333_08255 [Pseudonocardiaceae bacterium]|jgi:hypothetical protein|nr:hypothetical protein [Pseudonocardiaceae bacterium]